MADGENWLTKEFLEELLQKELKKPDLAVSSFTSERATAPGDNYASLLLRIVVTLVSGETVCLVTKTLPNTGEILYKMISEANIFQRECDMYQIALPIMNQIMKDTFSPRDVSPLTARSFYTDRPNTVILQDLKPQGYKMVNRQKRLDLEHSSLVIKNIAKFHALSLAMFEKHPVLVDKFPELLYRRGREELLKMAHTPNMLALGKFVSTWPGYESYGKSIQELADTGVEKLLVVLEGKSSDLKVLNHGDCWVNNFLFKYSDSGQLEDMKFVDLQLGRYSSFALDIQYFFATSLNDLVWGQCRTTLLELYHKELSRILKILGYSNKVVSFSKLRQEYESKDMFGMCIGLSLLALVLADPSEIPDMSQYSQENYRNMTELDLEGPMFAVFRTKKFSDVLRKRLIEYRVKGLL